MINQAQPELVVNGMVGASLLFWGAWGIFDKKALSYTAPVGQLAAVYCFSPLMALTLVAILTVFSPGWQLSSHTLIYEGLASLSYFIGTLAYLVAMSRGEASLILGATASYPVLAQLLANVMLGEALVPTRILGAAVVVAGVVAIGRSTGDPNSTVPSLRTTKSLGTLKSLRVKKLPPDVMATVAGIVVAVVGWAYRGIFDKMAVDAAQPLEVNLGKYIWDSALALVAMAWVICKRSDIKLFSQSRLWPCATGSALCLAGGGAAYFVALSMVSASYVIAITGCYPVIMYFLAMIVLKEKFNTSRAIGIGLITLGGILTQMTQHC